MHVPWPEALPCPPLVVSLASEHFPSLTAFRQLTDLGTYSEKPLPAVAVIARPMLSTRIAILQVSNSLQYSDDLY